ncbi:PQQ-binding-like beta-propeller repeat protein [bacterium]|nr:PQQ-binding-like beta-propeller repeat protein [candidate division CSSED10-310 bacterium]
MDRTGFILRVVICIMLAGCSSPAEEPDSSQTQVAAGTEEQPLYYMPADIKLLPDGKLLVAFGCCKYQTNLGNMLAIFSKDGALVKEVHSGSCGLHTVEVLPDGSYLISEKDNGSVSIIDTGGDTTWSFQPTDIQNFAPNDAVYSSHGTFLISDCAGRLLEVDRDKQVKWMFNAGDNFQVHDVDELPDGNLLFCMSGMNRVVEIDRAGEMVWEYAKDLDWPRNVVRLENGHTLITDKRRCIELNTDDQIIWEVPIGGYNTLRADDGHTIICTTKGIIKVNHAGETIWNLRFKMPPDIRTMTGGLTEEQVENLRMIGYID